MTRAPLILLAPILLFSAACSDGTASSDDVIEAPPPASEDTGTEAPATPVDATSASPASGTVGGDGSDISLMPVTGTDMPDINGELGCSFTSADGEILLVAKADVASDATPQAGVNNSGYGERLASPQTGGFSALENNGATFSGRGLTITVSIGEREETGVTETVTQSAEMLVQRGDGAERTYQGDWVCGP